MNDREKFLAALANNEDDVSTRLVYADWLEERGEDDEAQRMRAWQASKDWVVGMITKHAHDGDYDYLLDEKGTQCLYRWLIDKATKELKELEDLPSWRKGDDRPYINFGNQEQLQGAMQGQAGEFWRHVGVLTGLVLPKEQVPKTYFGCSC